MTMKVIFYITDESLTCYKEQETIVDVFQWEEPELIDAYLSSLPDNSQASLVLDVVEEDIYNKGNLGISKDIGERLLFYSLYFTILNLK